jgi:hypothetical protein
MSGVRGAACATGVNRANAAGRASVWVTGAARIPVTATDRDEAQDPVTDTAPVKAALNRVRAPARATDRDLGMVRDLGMARAPAQVPARAQGPDMDAGLATGLDRDMARGPAQDPAKARDPAMDLGRATDQARAIRTDRVATPPAPEIDAERLPQQPR